MGEVLHDSSDYVARARSLGPSLAAAADEIERNRELSASIVSVLVDNGVRSPVPSWQYKKARIRIGSDPFMPSSTYTVAVSPPPALPSGLRDGPGEAGEGRGAAPGAVHAPNAIGVGAEAADAGCAQRG